MPAAIPTTAPLTQLRDLLGHLGLGELDLLADEERHLLGDVLDRLAELGGVVVVVRPWQSKIRLRIRATTNAPTNAAPMSTSGRWAAAGSSSAPAAAERRAARGGLGVAVARRRRRPARRRRRPDASRPRASSPRLGAPRRARALGLGVRALGLLAEALLLAGELLLLLRRRPRPRRAPWRPPPRRAARRSVARFSRSSAPRASLSAVVWVSSSLIPGDLPRRRGAKSAAPTFESPRRRGRRARPAGPPTSGA